MVDVTCWLRPMSYSRPAVSLALAWGLLGVGMGFGLYEAAFATAAGVYGRKARKAITLAIHSGQSTKEVIAWAKNELEGFMR